MTSILSGLKHKFLMNFSTTLTGEQREDCFLHPTLSETSEQIQRSRNLGILRTIGKDFSQK